jgi:hypothetical protein
MKKTNWLAIGTRAEKARATSSRQRGKEENYLGVLKEKVNEYKEKEPNHLKGFKNIDNLITIGNFLNNLQNDKEKISRYKNQLIEFLDKINTNPDISKKKLSTLVDHYLSDIFSYLVSEYSFYIKGDWFYSAQFFLIPDVVLMLVGLAKYYYYIPIFTILSVINNIRKARKAKKNGRYIDFY